MVTLTVALLGGESSGKTALATALHQTLQDTHGIRSAVVPEHLIEDVKGLEIVEGKPLGVPVYLQYFKQPYYSKLHQSVVQVLRTSISNGL